MTPPPDPPTDPAETAPIARLSLPDQADSAEAAAIAAAIGAHLTDRRRAEVTATAEAHWRGVKWKMAGRLAAMTGRAVRVTDDTPRDPWTAAGRADRL